MGLFALALAAIGALVAWLGLTDQTRAGQGIKRGRARSQLGTKVARYTKQARQAFSKTGTPASILLSVVSAESAGKNKWKQSFHPDGTSWGLVGLTENPFQSLGKEDTRTEGGGPSPQKQLDIAGAFLWKLRQREGSWYEALKW